MKKPHKQSNSLASLDLEASFVSRVRRFLEADFQIDNDKASAMIQGSSFVDTLRDDPEFVMHYSAKYWAREIFQENAVINQTLN